VSHWPTLIHRKHISQTVHIDDQAIPVEPVIHAIADDSIPEPVIDLPQMPDGPSQQVPLGKLFATRSGDKGGNANLGVWAKTPAAYAFLRQFLTVDCLRNLLPDINDFEVERYELANLLAINFYIKGLLGDGVAASWRSDPQAKTLGEYLRAKMIDVPIALLSPAP